MALPSPSTFLYSIDFRKKLFNDGRDCFIWHTSQHACYNHMSSGCFAKLSTRSEFIEPNKLKIHISNVRKQLTQVASDTVKHIPWKKAENVLLLQLLSLGHMACKWSLVALFVCSFLSDAMYSILRDRELLIPIGLLIGSVLVDFLKESFLEINVAIGAQVFLLHVANGGLLQALWLWRNSVGY
ncbi:hypothetical protein RJ641_029856 [Dillenia turbinata]|uniref:Uncharacterized protein n=1 Tax=Dillenia turbinata TaxID=194707 RepID=A0AAN8VU76_9MAGN